MAGMKLELDASSRKELFEEAKVFSEELKKASDSRLHSEEYKEYEKLKKENEEKLAEIAEKKYEGIREEGDFKKRKKLFEIPAQISALEGKIEANILAMRKIMRKMNPSNARRVKLQEKLQELVGLLAPSTTPGFEAVKTRVADILRNLRTGPAEEAKLLGLSNHDSLSKFLAALNKFSTTISETEAEQEAIQRSKRRAKRGKISPPTSKVAFDNEISPSVEERILPKKAVKVRRVKENLLAGAISATLKSGNEKNFGIRPGTVSRLKDTLWPNRNERPSRSPNPVPKQFTKEQKKKYEELLGPGLHKAFEKIHGQKNKKVTLANSDWKPFLEKGVAGNLGNTAIYSGIGVSINKKIEIPQFQYICKGLAEGLITEFQKKKGEERSPFEHLKGEAHGTDAYQIYKDTGSEPKQSILELKHNPEKIDIVLTDPTKGDNGLFLMVVAAKRILDELGEKQFKILHCEDKPEIAVKLYLIGKSLGLKPVFKDAPGKEGSTLRSIESTVMQLKSDYDENLRLMDIFNKANKMDDSEKLKEFLGKLQVKEGPTDAPSRHPSPSL